ncbi:hypothetical protein [Streptomyces sp. WM6368]|uniref:hypothetical protein n=1 Tax=Streptomyces sp. WM6368 TaxID=1415554 RepID=UPI0006B03CEE|nr:hypothetical protein [Streptomyces sp. WM6368]
MARILAAGRSATTDPGTGHEAVQRATAHQVLRSPGRPLGSRLREEMESGLGADFSDVRVTAAPSRTRAHPCDPAAGRDRSRGTTRDTGHGLRVSGPGDRFEREAEANASRVTTGAAPVQRAARDEHGTHGTHQPHGPGAVALKGPEDRD